MDLSSEQQDKLVAFFGVFFPETRRTIHALRLQADKLEQALVELSSIDNSWINYPLPVKPKLNIPQRGAEEGVPQNDVLKKDRYPERTAFIDAAFNALNSAEEPIFLAKVYKKLWDQNLAADFTLHHLKVFVQEDARFKRCGRMWTVRKVL